MGKTDHAKAGGLLAKLVQDRIDTGETTRSIAQRARDAGEKLSHAQVALFRTGGVKKAPDDAMQAALAVGLQIPPRIIRRAVFLDWYGYDPDAVNPQDTRDAWPVKVQTFLDIVGAWLASKDTLEQDRIIAEMTRRMVLGDQASE